MLFESKKRGETKKLGRGGASAADVIDKRNKLEIMFVHARGSF